MVKIVISYRRQDSDAISGRIRDRLADEFGDQSVFMDIDSIPIGANFHDYIAETLANADVLLVVIGPAWLGDKKRRNRIHNPTDAVRIELEKAFELRIPIWPILVNRAVMPDMAKLPETLKQLSYCNAATVDAGMDFHSHMDRLIRQLETQLDVQGSKTSDVSIVSSPAPASDEGKISRGRGLAINSKAFTQRRVIGTVGVFVGATVVIAMAWVLLRPRLDPFPAQPSTVAIHVPSGSISCNEEKKLRSLGTTNATAITFVNRASNSKGIYWVDFNGGRKLYGTLQHGQSISIRTYITHPWVIADSSGGCEAIYMPTTATQTIEIHN
jgi:hypothetical protein